MASGQPTPSPFGHLLRRLRRAAHLTQEELAERAGVSLRGVSDLERGINRSPRRETVQLLADALQLGPQDRATLEAAARARISPSLAVSASPSQGVPGVVAATGLPPFVGRQREMARIARHLAVSATDGTTAPLLLVVGEPGIGKSRLLAEAARRASAGGWQVLSGGCTRRSGQQPYAPFGDTLARSLTHLSLPEQRRALQGCAWLVRLLPELLETAVVPAPSWTLPADQERRLMFAAVARYLRNVAGPAGTLLVLDDLQWAGGDALDLLDSLVRAATDASGFLAGGSESLAGLARLRIVGAYRSTEVDAQRPLGILHTDLARAGLAARCTLGPLSPAEARTLAEELVLERMTDAAERDVLVERLMHQAGGVPFYLVNCAQAAQVARAGALDEVGAPSDAERAESIATGIAGTDGEAVGAIPWLVAETIRQRVAALSRAVGELLDMAAVIGRVAPAAALLALTAPASAAGNDEWALGALKGACAAGLLREDETDVHFVHDLIREVVLADLSMARRRALHLRVANAFVALPEAARERHLAEIAYHYLEADDGSAALPYTMRAGDHAAAMYANEDAERLYTLAIGVATTMGDGRSVAEAQFKLGQLVTMLGRLTEGWQRLEAALAGFHATADGEGIGRAEMALAINCGLSARMEEAIAHLLALRDLVEPVAPPREVALVYHWLSACYVLVSRHGEELAAAVRAVEYARRAGDPVVVALAEMRRGAALIRQGRIAEGAAAIEPHLPLGPWVGDATIAGNVLATLSDGYLARGDLAAAERYLAEAERVSEECGYAHGRAWVRFQRGRILLYRGRWDDARASLEDAVKNGAESDQNLPCALVFLGHLLFLQGDRAGWQGYQMRALAMAEERTPRLFQWDWQPALAEQDLLAGEPEMAVRRLQHWLELLGDELHLGALPLLVSLAEAYLAMGRDIEAEVAVTRALDRAVDTDHRLALVDALRVRARIERQRGARTEAEATLGDALALARAIPHPYAEAKALFVYGQLHAAKGDPEQAREQYETALAICERLGEGLYRQHIERALASISGE
jgi:tetratricopeptide (TPR) repeat protein/transcriptional regulator with XRE-family HTH domain